MYANPILKPLIDIIAFMSAVWSKIEIFRHINLEDVFMCTDPNAIKERQRATSVHSTTITPWKTQLFPSTAGIDSIAPEAQKATPVHSIARTAWKSQPFPSTAEIDSIAPEQLATKEKQKATSVHSTTRTPWKTQPFPTTTEIDSIAQGLTHLEKANESSYLIVIIASVLAAFVILGTGVALLLFLVYRPRKKGSKLKIQRCMRQGNSIKLKALDSMSLAEQDEAAFHLDHVMQDVGEVPSQVMVDEGNCKLGAAISSAGLEKELTRDEDAIVKQNASGQACPIPGTCVRGPKPLPGKERIRKRQATKKALVQLYTLISTASRAAL
ncbi:uncharacterized protein LOC141887090 isoform X2 [Acropora palmata]|uniref:uncharacterized protein LOC141887090 isoform X2 n=1 Tax=Acropora palmata TaxID=6131 RepID=UPI003DA08E2F